MIAITTYTNGMTLHILADASDICEEFFFDCISDEGVTVFGSEYQVKVVAHECLSHRCLVLVGDY